MYKDKKLRQARAKVLAGAQPSELATEIDDVLKMRAGTPGLLVYCRLKGDERGNGYGHINDDQCGIFYVSRDDFAALCRRYLKHISEESK